MTAARRGDDTGPREAAASIPNDRKAATIPPQCRRSSIIAPYSGTIVRAAEPGPGPRAGM